VTILLLLSFPIYFLPFICFLYILS
jgi:hypothetical protein